jgi:predicted RNase H-like HicB family nuclease
VICRAGDPVFGGRISLTGLSDLPSSPSTNGATILRAGVEEIEPNYWVLSVFDLIGCYSSGRTEEEAVAWAERRVNQYFNWIGKKDGKSASLEESIQVTTVERFHLYPWPKDPSRFVKAFFEDDARPLRVWDIDIALRMLEWSRQDLLQLTGLLLPDSLVRLENEPNWKTLDGLLGHIWESENGILGTLGTPVDLAEMPSDSVGRLQAVRSRLRTVLPQWAEKEIERELMGEKWSPRKVLRRALWHERDHTGQLEEQISRTR